MQLVEVVNQRLMLQALLPPWLTKGSLQTFFKSSIRPETSVRVPKILDTPTICVRELVVAPLITRVSTHRR